MPPLEDRLRRGRAGRPTAHEGDKATAEAEGDDRDPVLRDDRDATMRDPDVS